MSLWKRGNIYWSYIYVDGVRHCRSTRTGNLRLATQIEERFRTELALSRNQIVEPKPELTVGELSARFLADGDHKAWHLDRLTVLLPYWGEIQIGRINKAMAVDYRKRRHSSKSITDTTINRDLEALRHILFWAVEQGLLLSNPLAKMRLVPERRIPRTIISLEDEEKLIAAASPHLRAVIIAALDTGMRRGELLNQRWEHVDFSRRLLVVTRSKTAGGEGREIPITDRVYRMLVAIRRTEGPVFTYRGESIHAVKRAWKATVRRAGILYRRFHDLRHTFNSRLMEAGVLQEIRKSLMGHSLGEDVNAIYTHVELPAKREAIRKLEAWLSSQVPDPMSVSESASTKQRKEELIERSNVRTRPYIVRST